MGWGAQDGDSERWFGRSPEKYRLLPSFPSCRKHRETALRVVLNHFTPGARTSTSLVGLVLEASSTGTLVTYAVLHTMRT